MQLGIRVRSAPKGHTLLELAAAVSILAITLVPALRLLRDGLEVNRRIDTQAMLTTMCTGKLEEQLCLGSAAWTDGSVAGDFSADGFAELRFLGARSQQPSAGGIVNRLMAISVTTWQDLDGDAALDSGEPSVTMASKTAKMAKYITAAGS